MSVRNLLLLLLPMHAYNYISRFSTAISRRACTYHGLFAERVGAQLSHTVAQRLQQLFVVLVPIIDIAVLYDINQSLHRQLRSMTDQRRRCADTSTRARRSAQVFFSGIADCVSTSVAQMTKMCRPVGCRPLVCRPDGMSPR